jgi:capsular polysaccharide biosynthesis protein
MELNDIFRRILGQHWRLLCAFVLVGQALGLLFAPHGTQYAASARLVLDLPDPVARQQSEAYADTAKAIATSPSKVSVALHKAGASRGDPAAFAGKHVSVRALGSSGVIELTVTDRDRGVAATVANTLAGSLIRTREKVTNGQVQQAFANLDGKIAQLSKSIAEIDSQVDGLSVQIAAASSTEAAALRTKRDEFESTREFLVQQRAVVQSERVSLLSASAQHPQPSIISKATPPAKAQGSHRLVYVVLGALLGLILGIGVAALIESVRPTLVGGDTLADELDAALLGTLEPHPAPAAAIGVSARLRLAAEAARVRNVALVAAGPMVDLDGLADSLKASAEVEALQANGNGAGAYPAPLRIASFNAEHPPFNNGSRSGLVLVSPTALKKTELSDVAHLLQASRLPLLGVITYDAAKGERGRGMRNQFDQLKRMAPK